MKGDLKMILGSCGRASRGSAESSDMDKPGAIGSKEAAGISRRGDVVRGQAVDVEVEARRVSSDLSPPDQAEETAV